jgi:hypothetical protein
MVTMKILSFVGQAILLVGVLVALIFFMELFHIPFKKNVALSIIAASGLVGVIGITALVRQFVRNCYVPKDLLLLMMLLLFWPVLFIYKVGAEGLMAPNMYDISTDTRNPPALIYGEATRMSYDSSTVYRHDLIAEQLEAYPDIKSLHIALPIRDVFAMAIYTAAKLGWSVRDWDSKTGHIDVVHKTNFFVFKADIAIRVTPVGADNSIIDVRSASVTSGRDFGFNARRIRAFFAGINVELKKRQKH